MFEPLDSLRDALRGLSARLDPDERRRVSQTMREALVHAKLGIQELRDGVVTTEKRLSSEQSELDTVRRRQALAAQIHDEETVAIAARFAAQHADRVQMLESKLMVQQQELLLAERDYEAMSAELRRAMSGLAPDARSPDLAAAREVDDLLSDVPRSGPSDDAIEPPAVRRTRAEKEAEAEERLAALKRRMGK